ncbi:MAG: M20/M25/M40 family metallo-hydrolase [Oscillospiraceae bacterium]|nr:M20/M25/M40 family metallo-hydrolase [Oscillospiraceae bacterium]
MKQNILDYIDFHRQEALKLLLELAQIPAPSNHEERRAAFCRDWLLRQGAERVYIDEAMNVVYPVGDDGHGPLTVYMAHSDVVFPDTEPLPLTVRDGRIYCPGIGDDTANAVALLMAAKYIAEQKLQPVEGGLLLVINAGEEGLGNLKGSRHILSSYGSRIRELISFDDHDCRGVNRAVGSRRFRVSVDTEGGHSFTDFGRKNAIAALAALIGRLYAIQVPALGRSTYNVGTITGGTSVNTIAQHAEMLFEFRSDEGEALDILQGQFDALIGEFRSKGLRLTVETVGERPCGAAVDRERQEALMARASAADLRHYGRELSFGSGSTDCNIPLSLGIPAICVGCYNGSGAHTREEYVEMDSLLPGLKFAFELILHHFE